MATLPKPARKKGATPLLSSQPQPVPTKPTDSGEVVTPPPRSGSRGSRASPRSGTRSSPRATRPKEDVHPMARGDASTPRKAEAAASVIHEEGNLSRKHEMETAMKKASNRSWDKVFVVVHGPSLSCYKDQKHYKQDQRVHHEPTLDLAGAECEYATDYIKRPHVFRLRLTSGGEFLFMAKDQAEMERWISVIHSTSARAGATPTRSQTLPARTDEPKDSSKKKGFLTFKKK